MCQVSLVDTWNILEHFHIISWKDGSLHLTTITCTLKRVRVGIVELWHGFMVKKKPDRLEHPEKADWCIKVSSLAGDEICLLKNVPQNLSLECLKERVSRAAACTVTHSDYLCCGAEIWHDPCSRPLQAMNDASHVIEVTWVKNEGLHAGDQLFYTGPSAASYICIEHGDICHINLDLNAHPKYRSVFFPRVRTSVRIHEEYLSRRPPGKELMPLGCHVGDVFFYAGPPRKGRSGIDLMPGTRGQVMGAGLIENSVRLKFQDFPDLCSVDFENLSKDPPRSWSKSLDLLGRCLVRLCLCFGSSSSTRL